MITIKIKIAADPGMVQGWHHYEIKLLNTKYEDRKIYSAQKYLWISEEQAWVTSGSELMPPIELALRLKSKINKLAKEYKLELDISEVV